MNQEDILYGVINISGMQGPPGKPGEPGEPGSQVSVSDTGTSTNEVKYITIDDQEYKLAGSGGGSEYTAWWGIDINDNNEISAKIDNETILFNEAGEMVAINARFIAGDGIDVDWDIISAKVDNETIQFNEDGALTAVCGGSYPDPPEDDGTYTLKVVVSNGEASYSWVEEVLTGNTLTIGGQQ